MKRKYVRHGDAFYFLMAPEYLNVFPHLFRTMTAPKDPGHPYAQTSNIVFNFHNQPTSTAPFGYEHYISFPPTYNTSLDKSWPLILFLHGAGESQRAKNESYASIRHGVPKIILCYDKFKSGMSNPSIDIPLAPRLRGRNPNKGKNGDADLSSTPVSAEVCRMVAEEFITVTPSLNMGKKAHRCALKTELRGCIASRPFSNDLTDFKTL